MKYRVRIDQQTFEVEIKDIHARPVIAFVDGEPVEIWPEADSPLKAPVPAIAIAPSMPAKQPTSRPASHNGSPNGASSNILGVVRAPIPGLVTAVQVKSGDEVQAGQQLLVLEAMKMNNSIRSIRSGRIAAVHIQVGQQVKHNQLLVEFEQA
jgi:glutaconyl-CoA/methylmalonyl-CoA decarboxylase subunit gamma